MRNHLWLVACILLFPTSGCRKLADLSPKAEPLVPEIGNGWLTFDLQDPGNVAGSQKYAATYRAEGKMARFDFEVSTEHSSEPSGFAFGHGKFLAVSGSDASVLLRNLKLTLEAKEVPKRTRRVAELPFTLAILGTQESHSPDGGFFAEPSGNWTAMKIFLGKDGEWEVFLDFNPVLRKGEFSIKDPDYGDGVLRELAKVL